ncbi:hypothetical protein JCM3775_004958 [Rhodotorula graminis]
MVRSRTVLALLACALAASAQLLGEEDGGRYADFPSTCTATCDAFESVATTCTNASPGDSASDEAALVACMCTDTVGSAIEACGNCIASNTADMSTSASGATIIQLAVSFTRACGLSLSIDGVDAAISSVLADGGSKYSSERATGQTVAAEETLVATLSDDAAQTGGATTSAASASFTSAVGVQQTSMAGQASETSGSSAASASSTGDAGSGARSLAVGRTLGAVGTLLAAALLC